MIKSDRIEKLIDREPVHLHTIPNVNLPSVVNIVVSQQNRGEDEELMERQIVVWYFAIRLYQQCDQRQDVHEVEAERKIKQRIYTIVFYIVMLTMMKWLPRRREDRISLSDMSKVAEPMERVISSLERNGLSSLNDWWILRQWVRKFAWLIGTPFGFPVEPEVKII